MNFVRLLGLVSTPSFAESQAGRRDRAIERRGALPEAPEAAKTRQAASAPNATHTHIHTHKPREGDKVTKMARLGLCLVSLLMIASTVGVASASAATRNPEFRWCGEVKEGGKFENSECLKGGVGKWEIFGKSTTESETLEAKATGTQKFAFEDKSIKVKINCLALKLQEGRVFGGEGEKEKVGGTAEGIIVFEECSVEGFSSCKINGGSPGKGRIETAPLVLSLAFATKEAAEKEAQEIGKESGAVIWFRPRIEKEKGEQIFVKTLEMTPAGSCPGGGGNFPVETTQNFPISNDGGVAPQVEPAVRVVAHEDEIESSRTTFWVNEKEKPTERRASGFHTLGNPVTYDGKLAFQLKNKYRWWGEG